MSYTAKYPATIPEATAIYQQTDDVDFVQAADFDGLRQELHAVMETLGVNPQGEYDDVVSRLDAGGGGLTSGVHARQTSTQSCASGTATTVLFPTEDYDLNDEFNTADGKFTPAAAGYYLVTATVLWNALNNGKGMALYISTNGIGAKQQYEIFSTGGAENQAITGVVYLDGAGEYVKINVYNGDSVARNVSDCVLDVIKIG